MPGKSRYGKRKHSKQSKKWKEKSRSLATTDRQPATAQTYIPVPPTGKERSKVTMARLSETQAKDQYKYIPAELRSIGILTGIIMAILVVLALVLSKT